MCMYGYDRLLMTILYYVYVVIMYMWHTDILHITYIQ